MDPRNQDLEAMIEESMLVDHESIENHRNFTEDSGILSFSRDNTSYLSRSSRLSATNDSTNINMTNNNDQNQSSISRKTRDIFYCPNYFDLNDILSQTIRISVRFQRTVPKLGFLDPSQQLLSSSNHQTQQNNVNDANHEDETIDECNVNTINIGTKLELPLWIVKELNGDSAVQVKLPLAYNKIYREIFEADANFINLNKLGPNYYQTGKHLTSMNLNESEDIAISLLKTFKQRFQRLVNFALSGDVSGRNNSQITDDLDDQLLTTTTSISALNSMVNRNNHIKASNHHGRKSIDCYTNAQLQTSLNDETLNDMNKFISQLDNWEKQLLFIGKYYIKQIKLWENRQLIRIRPNEMVVNLKKRKILLQSTE